MSERSTAMILSHLASAPITARSGAGISKATRIGAGSLYPALASLEREGLIIGTWDEGPEPRRRVYALTVAGREQVGAMRPVKVQTRIGAGNWLWRKLVAPFFGG